MTNQIFYLMDDKWDGCDYSYTREELDNMVWLCKNCGFPLDDVKQIDVMIEQDAKFLAKQKPLTFCDTAWGNMVWEPFIRGIPKPILDRDVYFGKVIGPDTKPIDEWLTYRCRYKLYRRGKSGKDARVTVCKECGIVRSGAHAKLFLYPEPPGDADIFQYGGSFLFRESVYQYLDMEPWKKKVYITKLTVADSPQDGLDLPDFQIPRDLKWVAEHPEIERC